MFTNKLFFTITLLAISATSLAEETYTVTKYQDVRCCVDKIERDQYGRIKRDPKVKREHRKLYPCPTGAALDEPCFGWQQDHVISLACFGKDSVSNLQWLPNEIKTCKEDYCKDRWERVINCKKYIN